ncbi:MAG TPA: hypothetical protein VIL86_14345 [Tepidisphaeraceae bacterium]
MDEELMRSPVPPLALDYQPKSKRRFRVSRRLAVVLVAIALLGVPASVISLYLVRRAAQEQYCRQCLSAIGQTVLLYQSENRSSYPPTLGVLAASQGFSNAVIRCPAAATPDPSGVWGGYLYVNWSSQPRGSDWGKIAYPMIYDAVLHNHGRRGINVVDTDGRTFWDPNATWLKSFAAAHANAVIPIPK